MRIELANDGLLRRADSSWHDRDDHAKQQGIRMRKLRLAILFAAFIAATPAFAARCGGDFNTFVAAMSQEARPPASRKP